MKFIDSSPEANPPFRPEADQPLAGAEDKFAALERSRTTFMYRNKSGAGFTLLELLVTLVVMMALTSLLILYSRASEDRLILFRDQAKVVNFIMRAKSLAIQTFAEEGDVCGYGVHFEPPREFFIFEENCENKDGFYTDRQDKIFEESRLDSDLKFSVQGGSGILFIPPDPQVRIYPGPPSPARSLLITISDSDSDDSFSVKIKTNAAGQITTQ